MPWQRLSSAQSFIEFIDYVNLIGLSICGLLFPFFIIWLLRKSTDRLEDANFKRKYGTLYRDLDMTKPSSVFQPAYF